MSNDSPAAVLVDENGENIVKVEKMGNDVYLRGHDPEVVDLLSDIREELKFIRKMLVAIAE